MALCRGLRKDEGLCIETDKGPIDVIVRSIGGPKNKREGWIQVRGVSDMSLLYLKYRNAPKRLIDGVEIGIDCHRRVADQEIQIYCNTKYHITKKKYYD